MDIVWERISKHTAGNSASKEKVGNLKSELEKHVREKSGELFLQNLLEYNLGFLSSLVAPGITKNNTVPRSNLHHS